MAVAPGNVRSRNRIAQECLLVFVAAAFVPQIRMRGLRVAERGSGRLRLRHRVRSHGYYFPMQKRLKISSNMSGEAVSPVTLPR